MVLPKSVQGCRSPPKPCTPIWFGGIAEDKGRVAISSPKNVQRSVALPALEWVANRPLKIVHALGSVVLPMPKGGLPFLPLKMCRVGVFADARMG